MADATITGGMPAREARAAAPGPVLAADGTPLAASLSRSLRRQKLRALFLIAPLLLFILVPSSCLSATCCSAVGRNRRPGHAAPHRAGPAEDPPRSGRARLPARWPDLTSRSSARSTPSSARASTTRPRDVSLGGPGATWRTWARSGRGPRRPRPALGSPRPGLRSWPIPPGRGQAAWLRRARKGPSRLARPRPRPGLPRTARPMPTSRTSPKAGGQPGRGGALAFRAGLAR
jgi:hypothetical protein